jgi:hypothetical protein
MNGARSSILDLDKRIFPSVILKILRRLILRQAQDDGCFWAAII